MRRRFCVRPLLASMLLGLLLFGSISAKAVSANLSHSYQAKGTIAAGSLVSLDPSQNNTVVLADTSNGQRLLGVAVNSNDSLLAVDVGRASTQVATTGMAQALVSTLNGPIRTGDQISVSPFSGLGMKASSGSQVIGLAESDFNSSTAGAHTQTITDLNGKSHSLAIGPLQVNIAIGLSSGVAANQNLNSLQKLAKSATGRTVSTLRVVISMVVVFVAIAALVTLVYASVFGSIISIGRNPLAKLAIFRTLGSVLAMAAMIAALSTIVVFLLIR